MAEKIERKSLESSIAIAIALQIAKLFPERKYPNRNEIHKEVARIVVEHFERCGWDVMKPEPYRGWGTTEQWPARKSEA